MTTQYDIQVAMRERLLTLAVCTTGSVTLSATATGYARAAGSFLADGFRAGMAITTATGFTVPGNNATPKIITGVADLTLSCAGTVAEASDVGRVLAVGLPTDRAWENDDFQPQTGRPFIEEQFPSGPTAQVTVGPGGDWEFEPLYIVSIFVPYNSGFAAAAKYADALLIHFAPRTAIPIGNDFLRVRHDVGPFRSQLLRDENGFSFISVSIPIRLRTPNVI